MKLLLLLFPLIAISAGRIQNSDVKSEAEILAAGGTKSQLINDSKIYLGGSINKRLDEAITDGDIGGGSSPVPLSKGQLITHNGTTYVAANACADGEVIEWDSTQTNGFKCVTKPLEKKYVQRLATAGAGTWTRSSANVKKVEFYYCGGGGAGGGALATSSTAISYGGGGNHGQLRKCTIYNPPSTIAIVNGAGGVGVAGGTGGTGASTTIVGCTAASGGTGKSPASYIGDFILLAGNVCFTNNTISDNGDTIIYGTCGDSLAYYNVPSNQARSQIGAYIERVVPELFNFSGQGIPTTGTGNAAGVGSCGGGGGGLNLISQTTTRAGGAGGSGQIVSYEYE